MSFLLNQQSLAGTPGKPLVPSPVTLNKHPAFCCSFFCSSVRSRYADVTNKSSKLGPPNVTEVISLHGNSMKDITVLFLGFMWNT